jgi:hypothetical protein
VASSYHKLPISVHNPIDSEDWPLDSLDVLPIALANGGDQFLAKHDPKMGSITLYLQPVPQVPDMRPRWRTTFWDLEETVHIIVDPQTGEIVEVE